MNELSDKLRFDGDVIASLRTVSENKWSLLFQNMRQNYQDQIVGTKNEDLPALKNKIEALNEFEAVFRINREV